jgi:hypothetical protein
MMLYKVLFSLMVIMLMAGCMPEGPKAVTMGGTADGDAIVSIGKVIPGKAEIGLTVMSFNDDEGEAVREYAVGPSAVYLVPMPENIADDWQAFTGGGLLFNVSDEFNVIPKLVAGVIYKPTDVLSPVLMVEKAWPSGASDSASITDKGNDVYTWACLRYRFK